MRIGIVRFLPLVALALIATFVGAADENSGLKIGSSAPVFHLKDQAGNPVSLADFKGKIVVLEHRPDQVLRLPCGLRGVVAFDPRPATSLR